MPPSGEVIPNPPPGYVIGFKPFHERGFGMPPSNFFRVLLHYYSVQLHHLNPNSVHQVAIFVALCEGYLGIEPNFTLWKYYFEGSLFRTGDVPVRMGYLILHLCSRCFEDYIVAKFNTLHKGWHSKWFYLRNDANFPFPAFDGLSSMRSQGGGGVVLLRARWRGSSP